MAFQHKNKWYEGSFTARYRFDMLVYVETFSNPSEAIEQDQAQLLLPPPALIQVPPSVAPAAMQKLRAAGADSSALLAR